MRQNANGEAKVAGLRERQGEEGGGEREIELGATTAVLLKLTP